MKKIRCLLFVGLAVFLTACTHNANISTKNVDELLPVGTIVKVKNKGNMLIAGIGQISSDNYLYDYIGYPYPEGYTGNNGYLFNRSDILEITFSGYDTEESQDYISDIEKQMDEFTQ